MKPYARPVLVGAICIALVVWLVTSFERVTEHEHVGFRGEAARNPLLAYTRMIQRMGLETRAIESVAAIGELAPEAILVLPRGRAAYTPERAERVRDWVESGGYLVIEAEYQHERDRVLDALRVSRCRLDKYLPRRALATIELPHVERPLRGQIHAGMLLADEEPSRTVHVQSDTSGTLLLHLRAGAGRVTVLPTFWFMSNSQIAEHDHAELAWQVVRWGPARGTVVIAPRFDAPTIFGWLGREARPALGAAALLIALVLWRVGTRFGPVAPAGESERRRLLDHLRASGRFLWRAGASSRLLDAARESCLQRLARTRPALAGLPPQERVQALARATEISPRELELAWHGTADTPQAFTAAVGTLQGIDEKLTRRL